MVCVYCDSPTQVVNSRPQKRSNHIWRRRQCLVCSSIFTTEEHAELGGAIMVQDTSERLQPFSRDQLFVSVYESCKHRETAVADATALTLVIIGDLLAHTGDARLQRNHIVTATLAVLTRFDPAAATYYQAYHHPIHK